MIDSYFFGEKLHLLVGKERRIDDDELFRGASVKEIIPSMEDVFTYLVKKGSIMDLGDGRLSGTGEMSLKASAEATKE